jgi:hypothetical protein
VTEHDELRAEIDNVRELVRLADVDLMETRQLLKSQTHLLNALGTVPVEHGEAIGGMLLAMNELQTRVSSIDKRIADLGEVVVEVATDVKGRMSGVEQALEQIAEHTVAILRRLGTGVP